MSSSDSAITERRIPLPLLENHVPDKARDALLNVATLAGSCFEEMADDLSDPDLVRLCHEANTVCRRIQNHIIRTFQG